MLDGHVTSFCLFGMIYDLTFYCCCSSYGSLFTGVIRVLSSQSLDRTNLFPSTVVHNGVAFSPCSGTATLVSAVWLLS